MRVSVNAPVSFDASLQQLLQLGRGATLVLVPDDIRIDPEAFVAFIRDRRIELLDATPTHLRMLVGAGLLESCPSLLILLVGGEAIDQALWRTLRSSRINAFNVYGPTEVTVDSVVANLSESAVPVIGRPLANVSARVIGPDGGVAPIGVAGELWLGGPQLADGYHDRPELTAERFVVDAQGERWYRTGDQVRYGSSGLIHYLGRQDDQVKIRGYRVEPGEVAKTLENQEEVARAVVLPRSTEDGDVQLVGYVVLNELATVGPDELRTSLRQTLPAFVVLDELPRLPSGKVDVQALASLEVARGAGAGRAPDGAAETLIADLCVDILRIDSIGADDDFFDIGGNSLSAARLASSLRAIGIDVPLLSIFNRPTVAGIAELVTTALLADLDAE